MTAEDRTPGTRSARRRKVAAFDFDGTVSRRDTLVPFVARFAGLPSAAVGASRAVWGGLRGPRGALGDRDAWKERLVMDLLAGRSARDLDRAAGEYAVKLIDRELRPEMVQEVRRHVAAGHETLFVSASLQNYLRPIARYLDMTDVIAVELEAADGRLTGHMVGPNVRADEKTVRLRRRLGSPPEGPLEEVELWAYGNSSGDHALLALADHGYWLGRAEKCPEGAEPYPPGGAFG